MSNLTTFAFKTAAREIFRIEPIKVAAVTNREIVAFTKQSNEDANKERNQFQFPFPGSSIEREALKPQRVCNNRQRTHSHGCASDHRAKQNSKDGVKDACGHRHAN